MSIRAGSPEESVARLLRDNEKLVAEVEVLQRKHDRHMADIARANALQEHVDQLTDECDRLKRQVDDLRAHRHHEVLCLVLKELVEARLRSATMLDEMIERYLPAHREIAVAYADAHYPPPKAEGT